MPVKALVLAFVLAFSTCGYAQQAYLPLKFSQSAAAAAPAAPALPFRYVGRLTQDGATEILLMRGTVLHSVAEGDEIDGEYRVERVTGASIQFSYLPGQVRQKLDLTAASR